MLSSTLRTSKLRKMSKKYYRTDHLFPKSNFITGAGTLFNLTGNFYSFNTCDTAEEADARAIESDWGVVGLDLKKVMGEISVEDIKRNSQLFECEK